MNDKYKEIDEKNYIIALIVKLEAKRKAFNEECDKELVSLQATLYDTSVKRK